MDEPQNTWSAPVVDPSLTPAPAAPTDSVVVPGPAVVAKRSKGPLIAVLAVLAVVVLGVGALVLLRGEDAEAYSLPVAAQAASDISTISYSMEMDMGAAGTTSAVMQSDIETGLAHMEMSLDVPGQAMDIEAVMDSENGLMFMSSQPFVDMGLPVDADWIRMDLGEMTGMNFDALAEQAKQNPLGIAPTLAVADEVEDLGTTEIDGVPVRHYRVTVDLDTAIEAQPEVFAGVPAETLDAMPDSIDYDIFVTEDNQMKRMSYEMEIAGQTIATTLDVVAINEPVEVEIPDDADVIDFADVVG